MIQILVYVVVGIIVLGFLWYASTMLPDPMQKFAQLVIALFAVIFLIYLVYDFAGSLPAHHTRTLRP